LPVHWTGKLQGTSERKETVADRQKSNQPEKEGVYSRKVSVFQMIKSGCLWFRNKNGKLFSGVGQQK